MKIIDQIKDILNDRESTLELYFQRASEVNRLKKNLARETETKMYESLERLFIAADLQDIDLFDMDQMRIAVDKLNSKT